MSDDLNRRVAEKIGAEPIVTYRVMNGEKCLLEHTTRDAAETSAAMLGMRHGTDAVKPHDNYPNYAGDLGKAWEAASIFAESKKPSDGIYSIKLDRFPNGINQAAIMSYGMEDGIPRCVFCQTGEGTTPALAICAAIVG